MTDFVPTHVEVRLGAIARDEALLSQEDHAYLPKTTEEASRFTPHEWVMEAMRRAYSVGHGDGREAAKKRIRDAIGLQA